MRTCYLLLAIDISGSMSSCAKNVREAVMTYLRKIAEMNADAVDVCYKVKILFFNDSVREHSTEFLDPTQILELLSESDFTCGGGTHIGKLYEALDRIFSRKGLIKDIDKGDPLPMFLAVSDLVETDSAAMEAASRDLTPTASSMRPTAWSSSWALTIIGTPRCAWPRTRIMS